MDLSSTAPRKSESTVNFNWSYVCGTSAQERVESVLRFFVDFITVNRVERRLRKEAKFWVPLKNLTFA